MPSSQAVLCVSESFPAIQNLPAFLQFHFQKFVPITDSPLFLLLKDVFCQLTTMQDPTCSFFPSFGWVEIISEHLVLLYLLSPANYLFQKHLILLSSQLSSQT